MAYRARGLLLALLLLFAAPCLWAQEDERAQFRSFNWFDIMRLDSVAAFTTMWDHASRFAAPYQTESILALILDAYALGKDLEKAYPYDPGLDPASSQYRIDYQRTYSNRLLLPWALLVKLNVRSAMQYILLEILYTKGVPKSKGTVPTTWTLFQEYFHYYAVMKRAS